MTILICALLEASAGSLQSVRSATISVTSTTDTGPSCSRRSSFYRIKRD